MLKLLIFLHLVKKDLYNIKQKYKTTLKNDYIKLDLTFDLIKLNQKISLIGNLNGKIKNPHLRQLHMGKYY